MIDWTHVFFWLNPVLAALGIGFVIYLTIIKSPPAPDWDDQDMGDSDQGEGGGPGGDDGLPSDLDSPLDLPPGVYVLPSDPVGVPV